MPTDQAQQSWAKWRESQLQAMLALGDAPQDAERVLAAMEKLSPDDPRLLPDPEAFAAMFGQVTPDDVRDATADWMVRARPEWKRLLTAMAKVSEFNPHHDALGRFAPGGGAASVALSYHALGRIGTQGRANVTSVRDALERLQSVKTPDSDWSYPVRQGDRLRGHLIGTDGVVKTVVGAWYKAEKLPPALAEFDPSQPRDEFGRWTSGGGTFISSTKDLGRQFSPSFDVPDYEDEASVMAAQEKDEGQVAAQIADIQDSLELDPYEPNTEDAMNYAKEALYGWSSDSASSACLGLHLAAEELYGSNVSQHTRSEMGKWRTEASEIDKKIMRAIYDKTQEGLQRRGYAPDDTVTVYRGLDEDVPPGTYDMQGNALESWTVYKDAAVMYAARAINGRILTASVPVRNIAALPEFGLGLERVGEVVVFAGRGLNNVQVEAA